MLDRLISDRGNPPQQFDLALSAPPTDGKRMCYKAKDVARIWAAQAPKAAA